MKLPQLTLRDLFWVVALVAMGCGWWVDRQSAHQRADEKLDAIHACVAEAAKERGLMVSWEITPNDDGSRPYRMHLIDWQSGVTNP